MQTAKRKLKFFIFSGISISKAFLYCLMASALFIGSTVYAVDVTLAWDPVEDPSVAGYNVYYGTARRDYSASIDVGICDSFVLKDLAAGRAYYITLTAYDDGGNESGYSNELEYRVPAIPMPWLNLLLAEDAG